MRTNNKQVREAIKQHILDCVYDYSENNFTTLKDACNHLNNEFERVSGHEYNLRRFPNNQLRFSDYLTGLPFHFLYENEEIENYLNSLGINESGKKYDYDKAMKLYHYLIYSETQKNL
jgi:hypothetical protein